MESQIVDDVTAALGGELVGEVGPVSVVGGLLEDNLGQLVVDPEDGVLVLVAHLDLVEDGHDLIGDSNSGRHVFDLFDFLKKLKKEWRDHTQHNPQSVLHSNQ